MTSYRKAAENEQSSAHVQRKEPRVFQEVKGEAEAEEASRAYLSRMPALGAKPSRGELQAEAVERLQRQRGNRFVQRLLQRQGSPGRLVGASQKEMVEEVKSRKGAGQPLPQPVQARMGEHFDADLSSVRVHADTPATELSRELNAQAFTVGRDIFFADGRYRPESSEGQGLIAHEVTHVGQQKGFKPPAGVQRQAPEEEEEAQAKLQRQEEEEEEAQAKLQRQEEEEEEAQAKLQRQEEEEEEAQAKLQRQEEEEEEPQAKLQRQEEEEEEPQARLQR